MNVEPIGYSPSFKIYKSTTITRYGSKMSGVYKGNNIEIYTDKKGDKLFYKLYYVSDNFLKFLKSKLVYFSNNKKYKTVWSTRNEVI